jgi:hypothetical protein
MAPYVAWSSAEASAGLAVKSLHYDDQKAYTILLQFKL